MIYYSLYIIFLNSKVSILIFTENLIFGRAPPNQYLYLQPEVWPILAARGAVDLKKERVGRKMAARVLALLWRAVRSHLCFLFSGATTSAVMMAVSCCIRFLRV
jgi:hypothetical protein